VLDRAEPLARNAVLVLVRHGRLALLYDLQLAYSELATSEEQILPIEVTTAIALDKKALDALQERISKAVGRKAPSLFAHLQGELHPRGRRHSAKDRALCPCRPC